MAEYDNRVTLNKTNLATTLDGALSALAESQNLADVAREMVSNVGIISDDPGKLHPQLEAICAILEKSISQNGNACESLQELQDDETGGIDEATLVKVAGKVNFVIKRLSELQHYCEQSRNVPSKEYVEQSHFIIGVCGHTLDQINRMIGETRWGSFDKHPANVAMGLAQ
jgi:hypothetical protein